jgi:hypothetical protein
MIQDVHHPDPDLDFSPIPNPDLDFYLSRIPDLGVKKAPDPVCFFILLHEIHTS